MVVDATHTGNKIEIRITKGRSPYKLVADSEKIAKDWCKMIRMESQNAGLDNPLQKLVTDACKPSKEEEEEMADLYLEYGGFKFAADEDPSQYLDYNPGNHTAGADGADLDDGGYLDKEADSGNGDVDAAADDYMPPEDDGYLEQQAAGGGGKGVDADEDGYLAQKPAGDGDHIGDAADDYVPSPEAYGENGETGKGVDADEDGYLEQKAPADDAGDAADDYVPEASEADVVPAGGPADDNDSAHESAPTEDGSNADHA